VARKKNNPDYARLLKQSFLLLQTPDEAAENLLQDGWHSLPFSKGQVLFGQGASQDCLGVMVSGRASARSGNGLILRSFSRGDIFGAAAMFAAAIEPFSEIVAESAGELLLLPGEAVRRLLQKQPQAAENYIRFLAQRIAFLNRRIASLSSGGVARRLASHILASSRPDAAGRSVCPGNISKLAQNLGISRASVYRAIEELQEAGCLHREGKTIVIDDAGHLLEYK
jgi:CRP-like cAMP-binding protein